jgi:protein-tyrosine-phosphatase
MAQVLLERMLVARGAQQALRVRSGGIAPYARDGMIPSHDTRLALREAGVDLAEDAFASTDLKMHRQLVAEADLIVTMTAAQKGAVSGLGEARGRPVRTLRELAGEDGDIDDPFGGGPEHYRDCRDEIARCLAKSLDALLGASS